jgi:hypothetical protein
MVTHRILDMPEAQRFGDLAGIIHDLGNVVQFCDLLVSAFDASPPQYELADALSTAAVIRYCRCFESGVRARLAGESIKAIAPHLVHIHGYLFDLRQKHLAHSVNEFEANHVAIVLPDDPSVPGPTEITVLGGRVAGLDRPTALWLKQLATTVQRAANNELEAERSKLLAVLASFSREQLEKLPDPQPFAPDWTRAKKKRPRRAPGQPAPGLETGQGQPGSPRRGLDVD